MTIRKKWYSPVSVERNTLCSWLGGGEPTKSCILVRAETPYLHIVESKAITSLGLILLQPEMLASLAGRNLYLKKETKAAEVFYVARKVKL